ncbi:methyltransferase [Simiduia curdlanivorans]|uniref:Methyltransferase n=1 Tax=Simiduia curdlanivorans TaxID=1492769 RepID=A0ABV8V7A9_9GAMM|nr:methyltransferase [Simiduia curdlanivorans]MDN3640691.1 methyltransferase [Simiduia curdlanivorans]
MLTEQFHHLDRLLTEHRQYWQVRAFATFDRLWPEGLKQCVDSLSIEQIWQLDGAEDELVALFSPWLPVGEALNQLLEQFQRPESNDHKDVEARLGVGIPGRKWRQIAAFVESMPKPAGTVLEWCAGKGHLGRVVSSVHGCEVQSLEWDRGLCHEGEQLAAKYRDKYRVDQTFLCADALMAETKEHIPRGGMSIALHACGDLHTQLLKAWVVRKGEQLLLAPCCYHLTKDARYLPLSQAAKASAIRLSKADLSLPLQSTVTGGKRVQRLRDLEANWRLSFDMLQRQIRGVDEYLPLPSIKKAMLAGPFDAFLAWAATQKAVPLPAGLDIAACLLRGQRRLLEVRRTELVSKLFRRAIELWLVLDRALYLQEQGAEVDVFTFCDYQLTPRNFMIRANNPRAVTLCR